MKSFCDSSMLSSCQSLSIAPLGPSADTKNQWPSQGYRHRITQSTRAIPRHSRWQISVSPLGQPKMSKYYQAYGPILSTVPNVTGALLVQLRLSASGPGSTIQRSTLSVLIYRNIPVCCFDKQYRYCAASPPLTDPTPSQRRRSTCSPAATLRKAIYQPTRPSYAIDTNKLEITIPSARKPSPSVTNSKDHQFRLPVPIPTSTYLNNAHAIPKPLLSPQRLLLVLDLNGTLLHRSRASQIHVLRP